MNSQKTQIIALAQELGVIHPSDVTALGLNRAYLSQLVHDGRLVRSARGIYSLVDFDVTEAHSLVEAVRTQSKGVICLLSALSFHQLGTQLPHQVWLGVPYGSWISHRASVPVRIVVMRAAGYEAGIETHRIEGLDVPISQHPKNNRGLFQVSFQDRPRHWT